jgi:2-polyprenyl-3-methyl-5-hydroxy-6-metoxy-1,4-benzoquinol methylase
MTYSEFEYESIPVGYYDKMFAEGLKVNRGLQFSWHYLKFKTVKEHFPEYSSHLDIACGPGTFIGNFLDKKSIGLDISDNQINYAKNTYSSLSSQFYIKDMNKEFNDEKNYDVITLLEFIEHISPEEVNDLVLKCMDKLNKNGKIIITTPNYRGLWLLLEKIVSFLGPVDYKQQHINRYTKKRIEKEMNYENVTVIKYINFGIFLSFVSTNLGLKTHEIVSKIFKKFFGYSLLITIEK